VDDCEWVLEYASFSGILSRMTVGLKISYVYEPRIEKSWTHWYRRLVLIISLDLEKTVRL